MADTDPNSAFDKRLMALGQQYSDWMADASIERCNCMVRYNGGDQMPARRKGKAFWDAEGNEIVKPTSFEDMAPKEIARLMKEGGWVYIGHMFGPKKP